jgi:apolipoprotein N-acyltransferase
MWFFRSSVVVLVALFVLGGVFGCESKGPGAQAGEKSNVTMEKTQEQTKESLEMAQEQTEETTEAAVETLKEAGEEVKEATK